MSVVKFVNEEDNISYDTEDSIRNLIEYIFNPCKTMYDEIRKGHMMGENRGCAHFFGTDVQEIDPECVILQMVANNRAYGKYEKNLIKHRVISFDNLEYIMPNEAMELARYIARAYGEKYITAYAVHVDNDNLHIHLAIDTVSWKDGSRFSESFEKRWLESMIEGWMYSRNEKMARDWNRLARCERYYGALYK